MAERAEKLIPFLWEGVDKSGRKTRGETEAPNAATVNATLRRQGIKPVKVRRRSKPLFQMKRKIKSKDVTIATRQLSTMIAAGIPIAQSFDILSKGQDNPSMRDMLISVRQDVEAGTNLSSALGKFPLHFDELYTNLVGAGEQSGTLDVLMDKIAVYHEKTEALKSKIKSALFYPAAVIVVAILVTAVLMIFVIPEFENLFHGYGAELPALTQMVINLSKWFRGNWWILLGGIIGSIVFLVFTHKRSARMRHIIDRVILRLPIVGEILRKATIARYARTLSTMFGAGVPLVDALESVAGASGNRVYHDGVMEIRSQVSTGQQLATSMEATSLFPNMVVQMVSIGEESGELELMLAKVADFYEQEVDDAVAAMSSLIEPLIMIFLGVVIGGLVVAMYLPIFKMASVV